MGNEMQSFDDAVNASASAQAGRGNNINVSNGYREVLMDLSDARFANSAAVDVPGRVYGVVFCVNGSDTTAKLRISFNGGGSFLVQPGSTMKCQASGFTLARDADSAVLGSIRLVLLLSPVVDYTENLGSGAAGQQRGTLAAAVTAVNVLTNIPTAGTDGIDVTDCNGLRAIVSADAGQTITGGTIVWWVYDAGLARWAESPVQETLATGRRDVATADNLVGARTGRAFPECRSVTVSGGALSCIVIAS